MIKYRFDVLRWLKAAGYNTTRIRKEALLGQSTLTKLRRGELLSWGECNKVCELLHVQPGDLFMHVSDMADGVTASDSVEAAIEFGNGIDKIAAAVKASVWAIIDGVTNSHMSKTTITEAVNMSDGQLVCIGEYLLSFVDDKQHN